MRNILILITLAFFASCSTADSKDDEIGKFDQIKVILPQGEWKVGKFMNGESNQTVNFESFVFTFNEDGGVLAQNDLFSETGLWNYYFDGIDSEELSLTFGTSEPFNAMSEDWEIASISSLKIELFHTGNGPTETKLLSFEKL